MEDELIGKNKPLRKAIHHCIDRQQYIDLFTNNRAEEAFGFIPPLMQSYDPNIRAEFDNYNVELAQKYAAQAENLYGSKLPPLKLAIPGTDVVARQYGQFYQKCFKRVGLDLDVDYMDWPTYLDRIHKKDLQIFQSGWIADYPDEENFLQLFYSKNLSPGPNNFNYVNSEFDLIFDKANKLPECNERTQLYRKAEKLILEDCPAAFMVHGVAFTLVHNWVGNFKPSAFGSGLTKYRTIDVEKRENYQKMSY
jgi:peptide/nickel transport system substrate-binding protein